MSKNRYGKMQGNMQYNRPSGGYQKNMYKQMVNAEGVKAPKPIDPKKFRIIAIGGAVVIVALIVVLTILLKWKGLLIGLLIGLAIVGGTYFFLNKKQKEMITYYKKIGMTQQMYVNELKKHNTDKRQIDASIKLWNKVKVDSIFDEQMKKTKKR